MRERKLPLRTVLQNFINHVDTLEVKQIEGDDLYEQQFQELKLLTESLKGSAEHCSLEGEKDVNRRKNRYKDILPYDCSRVVLSAFPGVPGSDYINANFIRGASGSRAYIASQGPLPHTTHDFWRMVVECEVQVIIMASNETEGGKHKCECYWVGAQSEEKQFGNVTVSFLKAQQVCPDFMVRYLKIKYASDSGKKEERAICQFHYVLWPDHGVPDSVLPLLEMVRLVRDCQASETLPVLVHCSAGCGRTGTICAIDYVRGLLKAGRLTENLDLFGLVKEMRRQRVAMVQTREQYILLHRAVREMFKTSLKVIDAHPYENIATDGTPLILREKESDYEELYVKPEKQDESAKPTPPTTAPSVVSTPTGSLTRSYQTQGNNNNYLATSSPISTLEQPISNIPPLPMKLSKPPPPSNAFHSSAGPHASPVLQSSPSHSHMSPIPHPSPVSFPSPSQAHYSSIGSSSSNLHHMSSVYANSSTTSQVLSSQAPHTSSHCKLGSHPASKLEKDAENAAHKKQAAQPPNMHSPAGGVAQRVLLTPSSGSPQPFPSNNATPSATPSNTPTLTHGISGMATLMPTPPTRSRTPSPNMTHRKSYENQIETHSGMSESYLYDDDERRKNSDIVRRPSIAKLKELFEKAGEPETPGVRLSRSASSVTSRTSLSVHQDSEGGSRIKRKSSLGAEETLQSKKAYEIIEKSRQLNVCPPPPSESIKSPPTTSATLVSAAKPPSSPVYTSPITRRKGNHFLNDSQEDGSTSALLARVDDRPALPVKKSKSFRYARVLDSSTNTIASTRSPELARKKADINTYFSLDRGKGDSAALSKSESGNVNFIGDIPSPREGFKLSVYQMPNAASNTSSQSPTIVVNAKETHDVKVDQKPQIPPKKLIGERFRSTRPPESLYITAPQPYVPTTSTYSNPSTPQSAPPIISSIYDNPTFWNRNQNVHVDKSIYDCPKDLQATSGSDYDNLPPTSSAIQLNSSYRASVSSPAADAKLSANSTTPITSESSKDLPSTKEYVNARVVRNPNGDSKELTKYVYHPLPSKRGLRDNRTPHEYANCSLVTPSQPENLEGEEPTDIYMDPHLLRKSSLGKFPLYDEVMPSLQTKGENSIVKSTSKETVTSSLSAATTPGSVTTPGSADYEVMDFGESSASVDEVFETVNYELIGAKDRKGHKSADSKLCSEILRDICSKKDLDPIARQVYQDCQDYLLHGNNKSPVPSLMPKPSDKENKKPSKPTETTRHDSSSLDTSMDVDEVKSKVNVAPQGLRTRERRNSYRQAVNPVAQSDDRAKDEKLHAGNEKTRNIHKYETIWFENGKHMTRRNNPSPNSQQNFQHQVTKSPSFIADGDDAPYSRSSSSFYMQVRPPSTEDHGLNLNSKNSNKDALFKEKLEELHTLVNSLERQKHGTATLPGTMEEDSNSRGSSSNNSTLQSQSTTSSKSSEPQEPIYANAPPLLPVSRSSSSSRGQQLPPRAIRNSELTEQKSPPPLRYSRTEAKLDNAESKPGRHSPLVNGNSLYGTIATSTFRSKQHGSNSSSPSFQNLPEQNTAKPPSPFHNVASTATLPARASIAASSPYHSIPPPKGFGNGTSPNNSPNPLQAIQQSHRESRESKASSPYYNMASFSSGKPNQAQRSVPCQETSHTSKQLINPYINLPVVRSNSSHHQLPKAHIVGDIAIVGEESVRLRRPGVTPSSRTEVGSGYSSSSEGAPVAPPRIKRNSSAGLPRHSANEPPPSHSHNDWRCSNDTPENYRQTILTAKQSWPITDDDLPPAVPVKTAAAYQYQDPPLPPPPHTYNPNPNNPPLHTPYLQPPPPKPVLPKSPNTSHHSSSQPLSHNPSSSSSSASSPYQSPPGPSQNGTHSQDSTHKSPQSVPDTVPNQRPSPSINQNNSGLPNVTNVNNQDRVDIALVVESSTDTSDDEGIFHKFSAPNLFKKWRTNNNNKQVIPQIPSSPKSAFSSPTSKEVKEEKDFQPKEQQHKDNTGLSSSTSPKPLVKAFGKLKQNSKSVAANFKSYLSQRVDKADDESGSAGNSTNGPANSILPSSPTAGTRNIQKSASSGSNINVFSQVVQAYKYPTPIPKKPAGPRDMPANMRGSTPTNPQVKVKTGRPRQQYL